VHTAEPKSSASNVLQRKSNTAFFQAEESRETFFGSNTADEAPFFQPGLTTSPIVQAKCATCEQEEKVQKKEEAVNPEIQPKLTIGAPDDPYEKQADAVADQVVQRLAQPASSPGATAANIQLQSAGTPEERLQEKPEEMDRVEESVQMKPVFDSVVQPPEDDDTVQRECADCEAEETLQKDDEQEEQINPEIQTKINIGAPETPAEKQADVVAEKVVQRMAQPTPSSPTTTVIANTALQSSVMPEERLQEKPEEMDQVEETLQKKPIFDSVAPPPEDNTVQKKCAECEGEEPEKIQRKETGADTMASSDLSSRLEANKGGGSPLPNETRTQMEGAMGADFSGVRVHSGGEAAQMSQDIHAQAFTHGSDIYFNEGKYDTGSTDGQRLLAHELTHTVQQGGSGIKRQPNFDSSFSLNSFINTRATSIPNIQAFGLSDLGDAISAGADYIGDTASAAVDWAGNRIVEAVEMGADAFMAIIRQVAPSLANLIQHGPGAMLSEAMSRGIQLLMRGIFGEFDLGHFVADIRANLSNAFNLIQGVLEGDSASCEAFNAAITAIRGFIGEFMDNPFFRAIRDAFNSIRDFLSQIINLVIAPVFDAVMEVAGEAFSVVRNIAGRVWGWISSVKSMLMAAWTWVMEQLGISGDGEGGIWEWLKGFARDIWNEIKATFAPVIGPLRTILGILIAVSPIGPVIVAIRYGPRVVEAIQWLWNNRNNPNIIQDAREQMGDTILPQLLTAGEAFINQLSSTVSELLGKLVELGSGLLNLIGGLAGIPLLEMARNFVQNLSDHVHSFITWVQESLQSAVRTIRSVFDRIRRVVEPYLEIISSIGLAILNPGMIPIILTGWAWRALPDCYKAPIINFLLDGIIAFLEALPDLAFMGPLWSLLKPFILGFLREFRGREDYEKIAITDKLARIISGASLGFIFGFVKGFLRGLWEGLTDPFALIFSVIQGIGSLSRWFLGLFEEATPATQAAGNAGPTGSSQPVASAAPAASPTNGGSSTEAQRNQTAFSGRMGEMGNELAPHVNEVTGNFVPAVQEHFAAGEGMTFDALTDRLGGMWDSARTAIQGAGQSLAQSTIRFFMQDSAEEEMGDGIGWLAGTIVFEVVLAILTAGVYTASQPVMRALQFFARLLDWTGAVLGAAFRMLARVGEMLMTVFRKLMNVIRNAAGAISRVLNALREIAERLIRYAQELLGRLGRSAGSEVAEEATQRAAREAAEAATERTAREGVEAGAEHGAREGAEEAAEETAEEVAEEAGEETAEQGARRGDEARKAAEMPAAMAEARAIEEANDRINTPVPILMGILNATLKPQFRWIERFGYDTVGAGRYEIYFTASPKHTIGNYSTIDTGHTGTRPTPRQSEIDALAARPGFEPQQSFTNHGDYAHYGEAGSIRPDGFSWGPPRTALEVKNYDISDAANRSGLYETIRSQYLERLTHLPQGTHQIFILDLRGQVVDPAILRRTRNNILSILNPSNASLEIIF
jgi:phage-related protein